ncbi:ribose 5-phosphate isomerase B, putative [Maribacter sp. HTCC2170]|nr:ribose 5-phosphate isomerase B, putative [Maribacter sp. HTCC2170]
MYLYICGKLTLTKMKISIGNDHAGTEYKLAIIGLLKSMNIEVSNYGTDGTDSVDYPDFVHPVAKDVEEGKVNYGIIICGSGNGASMTANKHQKIRCALCWNKEIVQLAREHNDANILSLPARFLSLAQALEMVKVFLNTKFEGGRHERRIEKIACS